MNSPPESLYKADEELSEYSEQRCNYEASHSSHYLNDSANMQGTRRSMLSNALDADTIDRPCFKCHEEEFQIDGRKYKPGLYWHAMSRNQPTDERISAPILITAMTCNTDRSEFGRILRFLDSYGNWHDWAMPMRLLKGSGEDLISELLAQGFIFDNKKRADLIRYIMEYKTDKKILSASKVGWHDKGFVLPNRVIGDTEIVFQSETSVSNDFKSLGDLTSWQNDIAQKCVGNVPLIVSISLALSGPLLKILKRQQGGGIHWVGDSSIGKSTCIEIAASVWGSPEFVRSWSSTANGFEGVAAMHNDTCIILDEIDEALPNDIGRIVYMLVNGQGKQRSRRSGEAREVKNWRTMGLSTGERTLSSVMSDVQKQPNTGQLIRLLNTSAEFEHGIYSNLHGFASGRELSDYFKSARLKNYGTLGPAFLEQLVNDPQPFDILYEDILEVFSQCALNKLEHRVASILSVIALAGELGVEYGLLPWDKTAALHACLNVFERWKSDSKGVVTEEERILDNIGTFIDKYSETRFSLRESTLDGGRARAGWFKDGLDGRVYMFFGHALDEAGKKYERSRIVKTLENKRWLCDHDKGRKTKKTRVQGQLKDLYYICIPESYE